MSRLNLPPASPLTPSTLQTAFDQIKKWSNGVLRPVDESQQYLLQFGLLGPVTSDGGGWCTFTLASAFPNSFDSCIAISDNASPNFGFPVLIIQILSTSTFRCFVNSASKQIYVHHVAIGH